MFTFVISLKQLDIIQRKGVYPNYGNNQIGQILSFRLNVCSPHQLNIIQLG